MNNFIWGGGDGSLNLSIKQRPGDGDLCLNISTFQYLHKILIITASKPFPAAWFISNSDWTRLYISHHITSHHSQMSNICQVQTTYGLTMTSLAYFGILRYQAGRSVQFNIFRYFILRWWWYIVNISQDAHNIHIQNSERCSFCLITQQDIRQLARM